VSLTREDLSPARIVVDHARLAEELSVPVGSLEQSRREHGETGTAVYQLASLLDSELIPCLRAEEGVLYAAPAGAGQADGIPGSSWLATALALRLGERHAAPQQLAGNRGRTDHER
jgi:hypothetical protein